MQQQYATQETETLTITNLFIHNRIRFEKTEQRQLPGSQHLLEVRMTGVGSS